MCSCYRVFINVFWRLEDKKELSLTVGLMKYFKED